jgi:hypothetical protein
MKALARPLLMGGLLLLPLHAGAREAPPHRVPELSRGVSDTHLWRDSTHWVMLGHMTETHLGARPRKSGSWSPQAIVTHMRVGDPLIPRPEAYARSSREPAGSLALTLAPLRFRGAGHQVSVLDLDLGYAASAEGSGTALQVGVVKLGFPF